MRSVTNLCNIAEEFFHPGSWVATALVGDGATNITDLGTFGHPADILLMYYYTNYITVLEIFQKLRTYS